ncbi:DUF4261 domain-containing protein [Flavobacterium pedocola]
MGLFDLFKKKNQQKENTDNNILLAMPMFNNNETLEFNKVIDYLKNNWNSNVSNISGDNATGSFSIEGETIIIANMPAQIPWGDIQGTAQYSYNWVSAEQDLENHNSHAIVSILSSNTSEFERFKILTKVLSSILATSNAIGIYQGSQSLLIPKEQYLESAEALKSDQIPLDLWVYIGLREGEHGNSAYTYGLNAFNKLEMEFINAKLDLEEMYGFLSNISAYVINSDITFKSGETLGYTAEQKIKISKSKGQFVEGQTLKLEI